jgi:hypothetical protein
MLWCAQEKGPEDFATALEKYQSRLTPELVIDATKYLNAWRAAETPA